MLLSENYLAKYTKLYHEHFGIELSREEAYDQAAKLLQLVKLTYQPMTEEDYRNTKKRPVYDPEKQ